MVDFNDRPRLMPLDPHRLQEKRETRLLPDGTRFSIERIRQITGAGDVYIDIDEDALTEDTEEPELLAPDHIIFYKPGVLPVFDGKRGNFYDLLKANPITLVLNVCKDHPIPGAWVSALRDLREKYPIFNFVRLQDIDKGNSHAIVYVNGDLQSKGFSLSHDRQICLSDGALMNLIEPIILDNLFSLYVIKKAVSSEVNGVLSPTPELASTPVSRPPRKIDPIELIERQWARKSSDW